MTTDTPGQVELRQSTSNTLQLPILIAVVLAAVVVSDLVHQPNAVVLLVCAAAAVLDAVFVRYLLRNFKGVLVVTPDEIRFSRQRASAPGGSSAGEQVIKRSAGSRLTFRTARNGPMGSKYTGYVLKLRDTATGDEVYAGAFGQGAVQKACESQGWTFD